MTEAVTLGISGITIPWGTHFCAFFAGAQGLEEIVVPYLTEGIRAGDNCICVIESQLPSQELSALGRHVDAGRSIEPGQLQLPAPADTYLRSGKFSADDMINYWEQTVLAARADGNSYFFRAAGEMPAVLDQPAGREFFRYEAKLNKFLSKYPQVILLCLYNLEHSGAQVLMDVLRTHPVVLVEGLVHRNPFYVEPDDFFVCRDQQLLMSPGGCVAVMGAEAGPIAVGSQLDAAFQAMGFATPRGWRATCCRTSSRHGLGRAKE